MSNFLVIILIGACASTWYFVKKKPDRKKRNISIALIAISFILIGVFPSKSDNKEDNSNKVEKSSKTPKKSSEAKKDVIELEIPTEIEADENGKAIISGKTNPNAKVSVGLGILGDSTEADKDGNFSLTHEISGTKEEEIEIKSMVDSSTKSLKIKIKPNPITIQAAEQAKIAEEEKKQQEEEQKKADAVSDITILNDVPTSGQKGVLDELRDQMFKKQYPYKGSKINSIIGVNQDWILNDGVWFYKADAVINNAFNSKRNATVEVTIQPVSATSGNVTIIDY